MPSSMRKVRRRSQTESIPHERLSNIHQTIFDSKYRANQLISNFCHLKNDDMKKAYETIHQTPLAINICKIFESFCKHHNMIQYITDIYNMPDIYQNGHYDVALFALGFLGSHLDSYFEHFNRNDFFTYTYFLFHMDRICNGVPELFKVRESVRNIIGDANISRVLEIIGHK